MVERGYCLHMLKINVWFPPRLFFFVLLSVNEGKLGITKKWLLYFLCSFATFSAMVMAAEAFSRISFSHLFINRCLYGWERTWYSLVFSLTFNEID